MNTEGTHLSETAKWAVGLMLAFIMSAISGYTALMVGQARQEERLVSTTAWRRDMESHMRGTSEFRNSVRVHSTQLTFIESQLDMLGENQSALATRLNVVSQNSAITQSTVSDLITQVQSLSESVSKTAETVARIDERTKVK